MFTSKIEGLSECLFGKLRQLIDQLCNKDIFYVDYFFDNFDILVQFYFRYLRIIPSKYSHQEATV